MARTDEQRTADAAGAGARGVLGLRADGQPVGDRDTGSAWFGGRFADRLCAVSEDPADLDRGGWWAVVLTFEGALRMWRFDRVRRMPLPGGGPWRGPAAGQWRSSLDEREYLAGVRRIRELVREGEVYQVNLCRVLSAPAGPDPDPWALAAILARGNPAPYAGVIDIPPGAGVGPGMGPGAGTAEGMTLVSASPELFLRRRGDLVRSGPIKGTAADAGGLLPKDEAENVMIVDLVRNDLQQVCLPGTVAVPELLRLEHHPGLVHLVSYVEGRLRPGTGWPALFAATTPPASVSGTPKVSALRAIGALEPVPRGPYCGAIGWVDADRGEAELAVGIRTFWWQDGMLRFGTGAGITWGSDPAQEWAETEIKADRLVGLATGDDGAGHRVRGGTFRAGGQAR
jgi:para-aminobenzoate synthetase component I